MNDAVQTSLRLPRESNWVSPPLLPDEIHDPAERRRAQKRAAAWKRRRKREVQIIYGRIPVSLTWLMRRKPARGSRAPRSIFGR
jgi:hypothetical protein